MPQKSRRKLIDNWHGLGQAKSMQVQLSKQNQKLIKDYRQAIRESIADYNSSTTQIVNHVVAIAIPALTEKLKKHAN